MDAGLINSADVLNKISSGNGRAASLAASSDREIDEKVRELYLIALSRPPNDEEAQRVHDYIAAKMEEGNASEKLAYEDVLWTLINTKEFLFNN